MAARIRRHLSYANVMATVAVFVALGGGAYAASSINGSEIKSRTIKGKKLIKKTVSRKEVKDDTLTGNQINESTLGIVPNADKLDGMDSTEFLGVTAKAADSDKLDGLDSTNFSVASETFRAGVANGVGNEAGCASGVAVVIRNGLGNQVDHRFTMQLFAGATNVPAYAQIRSDGSIRNGSANVTAVSHTNNSGVYCVTVTNATQAQEESTVLSVHDSG
jgi:hypothetical protein